MRVWRLTKPEHAPGLDGEGARLWGGRWNSAGQPMIYTASSLALAALETLAHLPPAMRRGAVLPSLIAVELDVPDGAIQNLESLNINATLRAARNLGDQWLSDRTSLGLLVPSRIIPVEVNLLLNPLHPMATALTISRQIPFQFDDRLF